MQRHVWRERKRFQGPPLVREWDMGTKMACSGLCEYTKNE